MPRISYRSILWLSSIRELVASRTNLSHMPWISAALYTALTCVDHIVVLIFTAWGVVPSTSSSSVSRISSCVNAVFFGDEGASRARPAREEMIPDNLSLASCVGRRGRPAGTRPAWLVQVIASSSFINVIVAFPVHDLNPPPPPPNAGWSDFVAPAASGELYGIVNMRGSVGPSVRRQERAVIERYHGTTMRWCCRNHSEFQYAAWLGKIVRS